MTRILLSVYLLSGATLSMEQKTPDGNRTSSGEWSEVPLLDDNLKPTLVINTGKCMLEEVLEDIGTRFMQMHQPMHCTIL
jgi:hypothetical protein